MSKFSLVGILAVLLAGCSWVQPIKGADKVTLSTIEKVSKCQKLGSTTTRTTHKVTFVDRNKDTVREELAALAKNEAVRMNADTIVPLTSLKDGSMQFGIYNCY